MIYWFDILNQLSPFLTLLGFNKTSMREYPRLNFYKSCRFPNHNCIV